MPFRLYSDWIAHDYGMANWICMVCLFLGNSFISAVNKAWNIQAIGLVCSCSAGVEMQFELILVNSIKGLWYVFQTQLVSNRTPIGFPIIWNLFTYKWWLIIMSLCINHVNRIFDFKLPYTCTLRQQRFAPVPIKKLLCTWHIQREEQELYVRSVPNAPCNKRLC